MIYTTKSTDGEIMYKNCTTEESVRRQRQLEACLQEILLTEPFEHITISHICDRAGISRKSFYRYFSSKEGCLCALLDHAIMDGASFYLPGHNDDQSPRVIFERFFRYWKEKRELLDVLARNGMSARLIERMALYVIQEEHEFRFLRSGMDNDVHEFNLFYIGGIMTLVLDWHQSGYKKSILQMSRILQDLL